MSRAVGKEATGSPESKSPLENQGSQRRRRRHQRKKREKISTLGKHIKDPSVALDKALKCVEEQY